MTQPVQQLNQFTQATLKGEVSAIPNPMTISVQLHKDSTDTLYPGDVVTLYDGAGSAILVALAAATDVPFGVVIRSPKKASFTANDVFEVAMDGSVINMESYSTIARGNKVEWYPTGRQVKQFAGSNKCVGTCLDKATATGQIVRIKVRSVDAYSSSSSSSSCRSSSSSSSLSAG